MGNVIFCTAIIPCFKSLYRLEREQHLREGSVKEKISENIIVEINID